MSKLLDEILEVPERAQVCYQKNKGVRLPEGLPYLGMGASYNAVLTLFYCGKDIKPFMASDYYDYLSRGVLPLGVFISQSGESSEVLWNLDRFEKVIAITNHPDSQLAVSPKTQEVIEIYAEEEQFASVKSYINTLIILYLGLGIDPKKAVDQLMKNIQATEEQAKQQASIIAKHINSKYIKAHHVIGSGPNLATALEGALTLSELTKLGWVASTAAQFDHGPKETAQDSIVLLLNSGGKDAKRIEFTKQKLQKETNALVVEFTQKDLAESLSPIPLLIQVSFFMAYLADELGIKEGFFGEKVTTVSDSIRNE
jgi:glutamine---fructose-6-phosphate transaminase (isomerizing)